MTLIKKLFYNILFNFTFFQKLFFINEKILFFNLTFFYRKRQLFKKRTKVNKAKLSLLTLLFLKISKINFKTFNLLFLINGTFKFFVTLLKNFTFSLILIYYFFTFLLNLIFLILKYFYNRFLKVRLLVYKLIYNVLEKIGFQFFFICYNLIYIAIIFVAVLVMFVICFYFFKTNYFNTDYFYINFFPYNNEFDQNFLSSKQLYYYRFSLWWIFRIYLFYFLIYLFVKDLRQIIKENLMFIIFLPIIICNFNFKFFIFLILGTFLDTFGSFKINRDMFFFRTLKKPLLQKRPFTLKYLHNKFNFLFSNSLVQESRKLRGLQASTSNNLTLLNQPLNLRDETVSYKTEILRIKKLKAIQDYYLDFKVIDKKNKILKTLQTDLLKDDILYDNSTSADFYYKFFYYSNFYSIGKKGDPLNLLKKNCNNLIKLSPYLDINLINNDNYKTFKTNNYYTDNKLYKKKINLLEEASLPEPIGPSYYSYTYID